MPTLRSMLVADGERRPRLVWRLLILLAVTVSWALSVSLVILLAQLDLWLGLALTFVVLVPPIVAVAFFVDRRSPRELGLPVSLRAWAGLLWGAVIGMALIAGIAAVEHFAGLARYREIDVRPGPLAWITFELVLVGIHEELLFRGYLLTNIAEGLGGERARVRGLVLATAITSLGFVLGHVANPNVSVFGLINIGLAGAFLALPYVLRGELGASIGLHFGWNFAQALLGIPVSGNALGGALVERTLLTDQPLVTGGAFGAEGGALATAALLVGTLVVVPLARATRDPQRAAALGLTPQRARAVAPDPP